MKVEVFKCNLYNGIAYELLIVVPATIILCVVQVFH